MRRGVASQVREIREDRALRLYGAALSLAYVFTAIFLFAHDHFAGTMSMQFPPVCWPYFESCGAFRVLSNLELRLLVLGFGAAALVPLFAFLTRRVALGYGALLAVAAIHAGMTALDFRNTQNQYYMLFWAVFAYLFWPGKRATLHWLIVSFYFWAGRLKLNEQWLSGRNLYAKLWFIPIPLDPYACAYVVFLETVMIWGLVSRSRTWFWATIAQLAIFHFVSISQIGTYYPALMAAILAIYPLARLTGPVSGRGETRPGGWALVGLFAFFQLYPSFVSSSSRDRVLRGTGRTFALNMFESRYDCSVHWLETYRDGQSRSVDVRENTTERMQCEPIYYYSRTRTACLELAKDPSFVDLELQMDIALLGEQPLQPLIRRPAFCSRPPAFNLFLPNDWFVR